MFVPNSWYARIRMTRRKCFDLFGVIKFFLRYRVFSMEQGILDNYLLRVHETECLTSRRYSSDTSGSKRR